MTDVAQHTEAIIASHRFRDILAALSRPGQTRIVRDAPDAIGAVQPASLAILATLCDYQTPIYLSVQLAEKPVVQWIAFETGAGLTEQQGAAAFALITADEAPVAIQHFAVGTHEYPDRSTTVILQLPAQSGAVTVELAGPGVGDAVQISFPGLMQEFWALRETINADFPLGLDFIFVQGDKITACPRSTRVRIVEAH